MIKKIKKYRDLPFELHTKYKTKLATGEEFIIENIVFKKDSDKILRFDGYWVDHMHVGICPLNPDRLYPTQVEDGEIEICENCGEPIHGETI